MQDILLIIDSLAIRVKVFGLIFDALSPFGLLSAVIRQDEQDILWSKPGCRYDDVNRFWTGLILLLY